MHIAPLYSSALTSGITGYCRDDETQAMDGTTFWKNAELFLRGAYLSEQTSMHMKCQNLPLGRLVPKLWQRGVVIGNHNHSCRLEWHGSPLKGRSLMDSTDSSMPRSLVRSNVVPCVTIALVLRAGYGDWTAKSIEILRGFSSFLTSGRW